MAGEGISLRCYYVVQVTDVVDSISPLYLLSVSRNKTGLKYVATCLASILWISNCRSRQTQPAQLEPFSLMSQRPGAVWCGREAGKGGGHELQFRDRASQQPPKSAGPAEQRYMHRCDVASYKGRHACVQTQCPLCLAQSQANPIRGTPPSVIALRSLELTLEHAIRVS